MSKGDELDSLPFDQARAALEHFQDLMRCPAILGPWHEAMSLV